MDGYTKCVVTQWINHSKDRVVAAWSGSKSIRMVVISSIWEEIGSSRRLQTELDYWCMGPNPPCSLDLLANKQQYFYLITNQILTLFFQNKSAPATSQTWLQTTANYYRGAHPFEREEWRAKVSGFHRFQNGSKWARTKAQCIKCLLRKSDKRDFCWQRFFFWIKCWYS
jgi:hypothetical protein